MDALTPLLAEIADKEPTISQIWAIAVAMSAIAIALGWVHRLLSLLVLPFAAFWAGATMDSLLDPYIGPLILSELGRSYIIQECASLSLPFIAMAIPFLCRSSNHSHRAKPLNGSKIGNSLPHERTTR